MRQMLLALTPVLLFVSAILVGMDNAPPAAPVKGKIPIAAYTPPAAAEPPEEPETGEQPPPIAVPETTAPGPEPEPAPPPKLADATICADSYGTTSYETEYGVQVQPVLGSSAQCDGPVAILREGRRYFGCPEGKIILDCDWFVQESGDELRTDSVLFGSSYVADFSVPDLSAPECSQGQAEASLLLTVGGKVCDLETLVGNINQMHGS